MPVIGGAEAIAVKLVKKLKTNSYLISLVKNKSLIFEKRFNIKLKNIFYLLSKISLNKVSRIFSHNIQAHIFLNFCSFIFKYLFLKRYSIYNVIHFDSLYINKILLKFYILSIKLSNPKLIFVSEFSKKRFNKHMDTEKLFTKVIYNSIDSKFFKSTNNYKQNYGFKYPIYIGFIGRLSPIKRLPLFLEICINLHLLNKKKYKFVIQSDISNKEFNRILNILSIKYSLNFNSINFTLIREYNDPLKFYESCEIIISTSITESFGLTCIETLAMGKRLYTINSESLKLLFNNPDFNIKCEDERYISKYIDESILKLYKCPNLEKFKEKYMLNEYSKI